ncbi:hypothetical protein ONJ17_27850, partial [Salmonella enterica subsp. enterica serovar Agona]|nr:hypothetical protein [Salmonella enterica subsp. enterica serovar Agona]
THVLPINEVVAGFESWVVLSINSMSLFDVAAYLYNNGGLFQFRNKVSGKSKNLLSIFTKVHLLFDRHQTPIFIPCVKVSHPA